MTPDYDAIVVGAGASGAIVASEMALAGRRVLLLERGPYLDYASAGHRDHLRNQRHSPYGHNLGPEVHGHSRVFVDPKGVEHVVAPHQNGYHNNAAAVGSGTVVYGALGWRFLPDDFRMASRYGVPAGSSLVDWPFSYNDLAVDYDRAEWDIGCSGSGAGPVQAGQRTRDYPMPPVPGGPATAALARGGNALGINTFTPPLLINSVPRDGRDACIQCGSCVGFPCPSNAKNGTQNTILRKGLATGGLELVTGAMVERVETDERGRVTGVSYLHELERRHAAARIVVLCGGAIETARLLLNSRSKHHPDGLGNESGHVGKHLQGHYYPTAYGLFDEVVYDGRGPGVAIATCDYNHDNPGIVGGGMLADDFVMLPVIFWKLALPRRLRRWGREAKHFMRENYGKVIQVKGPVHEIPSADCRVEVDTKVTDRFGLPVARLSGVAHPETIRTATYMRERAMDWLTASGAKEVWADAVVARLSGGQHQAGTCRMGTDPRESVTDAYGRVWGHDNLFVSDGSLHPTNGGFNPVLTIMALAFRNAAHINRTL